MPNLHYCLFHQLFNAKHIRTYIKDVILLERLMVKPINDWFISNKNFIALLRFSTYSTLCLIIKQIKGMWYLPCQFRWGFLYNNKYFTLKLCEIVKSTKTYVCAAFFWKSYVGKTVSLALKEIWNYKILDDCKCRVASFA